MNRIDEVITRIQNAVNYFEILNQNNRSIDIRRNFLFKKASTMISDGYYVIDSLTCLKNIMESGDCNTCLKKNVCEFVPKPGELVRYNCFAYLGEERSDV